MVWVKITPEVVLLKYRSYVTKNYLDRFKKKVVVWVKISYRKWRYLSTEIT